MAGARMRTKRTNLNQEGGEDEGQYAEHSRSYRGIGGGHRGNQEKTGSKGYFGQGRGSSTPKNISEIFGSRESIENYKKSLSNEMIVGMQEYTDANEKNMREHGMLTISEMLHKILEMQTTLADNQKTPVGIAQQKHGFWQIIRPNKAIKIIKRIWNKIPNGWYKNPYIWTGVVSLLVYTALFAASWMKWHEFRDENRLLKTVAAKHEITSVMLKELYPELAVTVGAYEELVDAVGVDSTLTVFQRQMKKIRTPKKK